MKDLIIKRLREESVKIIKKPDLTKEEVEILAIVYSKEVEEEYNKKLSDEHEESKKKFSDMMKNYIGGM
jgi:hypothetical protein